MKYPTVWDGIDEYGMSLAWNMIRMVGYKYWHEIGMITLCLVGETW